jgi:hypothetical protein
MPVFRQGANPKELRSFYDSQKRIAKMELENSKATGIIGTPLADAEGFNKLITQIESVENQLEGYIPTLIKLVQNPERVSAGNPADLFGALNTVNKTLSRITLKALPLTDIQTLKDYKESLKNYMDNIQGFRDEITQIQRRIPDPEVFNRTEVDLEAIRQKLSVLIQTIDAQLSIYDSGVAQPVKLIGGCMCGLTYNLDEPLSRSAMYQTPKYVLPQGGRMETRFL